MLEYCFTWSWSQSHTDLFSDCFSACNLLSLEKNWRFLGLGLQPALAHIPRLGMFLVPAYLSRNRLWVLWSGLLMKWNTNMARNSPLNNTIMDMMSNNSPSLPMALTIAFHGSVTWSTAIRWISLLIDRMPSKGRVEFPLKLTARLNWSLQMYHSRENHIYNNKELTGE